MNLQNMESPKQMKQVNVCPKQKVDFTRISFYFFNPSNFNF
jgi:hypothetical protein